MLFGTFCWIQIAHILTKWYLIILIMRKRVRASSYGAAAKRKKLYVPRGMAKRISYSRPSVVQSGTKVSPPGGVLATVQNAKLIYAENGYQLNTTSGLCGVRIFSLSSLFDPDVTGTGHQPVGYDQIMALYEEYIVKGVSYSHSN